MEKVILFLLAAIIFMLFVNKSTVKASENSNGNIGRVVLDFDKGWKFFHGDIDKASEPGFDDSSWRKLNVPHDWAIEGLYDTDKHGKQDKQEMLYIVKGHWLCKEGDDMAWKSPEYDDSAWRKIELPSTWKHSSNNGSFYWYRKGIKIPTSLKGKKIIINAGLIYDSDETYLNGKLIGSTGTMPPKYSSAWNFYREYEVNPDLINYGGKNIIAIRAYNGADNAGIWGDKLDDLIEGPFNRGSYGASGNGYLPGGIGWYRKKFIVPDSIKGTDISIEFDGVYMDSDVWINGTHLGNHPYGFTSFGYDMTKYIRFGEENIIAVRVNVKQPCTRWYSGAGIYRHVRLVSVQPLHIAKWGTYITTPDISEKEAKVRIQTSIENSSDSEAEFTLKTIIIDKNNSVCAVAETKEKIGAKSNKQMGQEVMVQKPLLWTPDSPDLYTAVSYIYNNIEETDKYSTVFGIRSLEFTIDKGFFLNNKHIAIKGVCLHHDQGYLGTAIHKRSVERQVEIMKSMGCNAIRTSHNPPAPELLDACDKLGMLVMDEAFDEWKDNKTQYGYGWFFDQWAESDISSMLLRDRNHPCVIMWSIGNEVLEQWTKNKKDAYDRSKKLSDICHKIDPTRPVTSACNGPDQSMDTGIAGNLDVLGINYNISAYKKYEGKVKLIGSETASDVSSRGEYNLFQDEEDAAKVYTEYKSNTQCSSYDDFAPEWAIPAWQSLKTLKESPWVAGEFVWTGFDYIGEPTPFEWPAVSSYFGIVDLCGFPKDRYYLYQSQWSGTPMVHILPHWNWNKFKGKEIPVYVYTNCDSAELFLNGKSLGEKYMKDSADIRLSWQVKYEEGELLAVAKKGGRQICTDSVKTAGKPAKIELITDRNEIFADGEDLCYITTRILDAKGNICPDADNNIKFSIEGNGTIAATGNGDATNHAFFNAHECKAFHGMLLAIICSNEKPGVIKITASAFGLKKTETTIQTK